MQFTISQLIGILLGIILLIVAKRIKPAGTIPPEKPGWPSWLTLGMGTITLLISAVSMTDLIRLPHYFILATISLPTATVILGIGNLIRGERRWPTWLGVIFGLLPVLFWVYFVIGEVVGLAH